MDELDKKFSQYYEYLDDIRQRLRGIMIAFMIFFVAGFFSSGEILKAIISFFKLDNASLVTTSPFQLMELSMNIGVWVGLIFCSPFLIYHLYAFFRDGLKKKEKKYFFVIITAGLGLFVAGFAYILAVLYFYLNAAAAINLSFGIKNIWDIGTFLTQVVTAGFFFGLIFQFPLVITLLIRLGIVSVKTLKSKRRYAIAGIFLVVGLIPPPDLISTFFEALPLIIIYEITIQVNSLFYARHKNPILEADPIYAPQI
jgi:sec-independent protein translocase protein TatC